jgi:hypothetical protein
MKLVFIVTVLAMLLSCNNTDTVKPATTVNDTTQKPVEQNTKPSVVQTAFSILSFDKKNIPVKDSIKGNVQDGASWQDKDGEQMVILTQTENVIGNGTQKQSLYAYCFIKSPAGWQKKWQVQDDITDCEFDALCEHIPGTLAVTDLDSNNIAEASFIYKLGCRSDVSPDGKKLIMYEGTNKYAIRGNTIIIFKQSGEKYGGDKRIDAAFTKATPALLKFANSQWDKFGTFKY